ncbi:nucleoside recognition domain-containing protein [Leptolyngbya sp. PCC 6406]|uniref:nucleoside recognition domain-containing protein n=1 Tax=Leptolyngbya sp. PCC 6406 TaxID=1173264 RepID=UPI0002ACDAA2|nr:nucleoside recognition domain-containing protein [Leptolyngbya sp. PCC 6406]
MSKSTSPLNGIWLFMIISATAIAAWRGAMTELTEAIFESAANAVTLAIGLIGALALWLGLIKVVEAAGMMQVIARLIRPVMVRLFPDVPPDHPAMSAIIMNMAANALGLGNAATPIGLKAMAELNKLNPLPGTATSAMCLFLAINTSSLTILPISAITVRAGAGATNPAAIILPSIVATCCSTVVAIVVAKVLGWRAAIASEPDPEAQGTAMPITPEFAASGFQATAPGGDLAGDALTPDPSPVASNPENPLDLDELASLPLTPPGWIGRILFGGLIAAFFVAIIYRLTVQGTPDLAATDLMAGISNWLLPIIICSLLLLGYFRGVAVYEAVTEGAKEGFDIAVRIIPFLVVIFVAIGMFRSSGALEILTTVLTPITGLIGMPPEALPMAFIRPLSGGGAFGVMSEIVDNDPDGFLSYLVSTMQGSTETTFYVMAVYFGSIGVMRTRYTLPAALSADVAGILASLAICHLTFG